MDRGTWWSKRPWGHKELDMTERLTLSSKSNFRMMSYLIFAPKEKCLIICDLALNKIIFIFLVFINKKCFLQSFKVKLFFTKSQSAYLQCSLSVLQEKIPEE